LRLNPIPSAFRPYEPSQEAEPSNDHNEPSKCENEPSNKEEKESAHKEA
jgi:hypothetical protein